VTSPLIVAPVLVTLVLALSGLLKARDRRASRDAFVSLRLPSGLTDSPIPTLLPWAELLLALGILVLPGWPGVGATLMALVLFCCYLLVIGRALRFDEPVTCGCFGKLGLGTVSRVTLARNLLLVMLAALAVQQAWPGESLITQLGDLSTRDWGWLLGAVVVGLLAGLVVHGNGSQEQPAVAPVDEDGEYLRQPIPFGQLRQPGGKLVPLRNMAEQRAVLLVFVNHTCGSCLRVLDALPDFARENPEVGTRAVFHQSATLDEGALEVGVPFLVDPDGSVAQVFAVGSPGAVLLGGDGLLAGGPIQGELEVLEFLDDIAAQLAEVYERPAPAAPGDPDAVVPPTVEGGQDPLRPVQSGSAGTS
jgi:hypothetical protein